MCGIVGVLGKSSVAEQLVDSLRCLEYRGYDSAGVATLENGHIERRRAEGKLRNLGQLLKLQPLPGITGIGHTRWATHGRPSETNAHPHMTDEVAVVHNGIIENFQELKAQLIAEGAAFTSDTDTEVLAHLITREMRAGKDPVAAVHATLSYLQGAYALAAIFRGHNDLMIVAREGSPLAIGFGDGEMFVGSDAIALAPCTDRIAYLEDGDSAVVTRLGATIRDRSGANVVRPVAKSLAGGFIVDKGNYRHFMAKEIHEQPEVVGHTFAHYLDLTNAKVALPALPVDFSQISRLSLSACGTAFYACFVAKYWFERWANLPVDIDIASEFRYREVGLEPGGATLFVSQSGETADTLASLRYCRAKAQHVLSVVNVQESSIARESDAMLPTFCGPEIGVASTKAFTCQLTVLACLAIAAGKARGVIGPELEAELVKALIEVPRHMTTILADESPYEALALSLTKAQDVLYLGRGTSFPIALEGALKLKEISYIHAEGYAAGELKHGPIALIDESVPVIVIAPRDALFEKTVSNMQEVAAREGKVILISDADEGSAGCAIQALLPMPSVHPFVIPLLYALPVQLIAYHTAVFMGTDVDQPRNLAKSVTVE
ncbi:glutamine--fructose-6-phosphate transaminase (isomerizing) [Methyloligella sp. 2.7D]|uniref:glutamine--fructose-6-phosphate transaminase (isomerizing) n=1 Tax=unclassified Methyloligella TaxID=2625955 RepID=UPI00157D0162|nr:glutamine--fructose-6-phosphate transaminase (isomerizing) [Methyloligella sp. GL2]QKP76558.1 glutamine--fructose-6-phosphate transaminase (isomerizing) [Methyloligella sp. GL2]